MRNNATSLLLAFGAAVVVAGGSEKQALAYFPFPGYVEQHLNLTTLPANPAGQYCELCHNNPNGGVGTATQPFGRLMLAKGILYTSSEGEVDSALDAIKADPATAGFIADIENGINPNTDAALLESSGGVEATVTPAFGCGATIAGRTPGRDAAALWAGALGLTLCLRRRPR